MAGNNAQKRSIIFCPWRDIQHVILVCIPWLKPCLDRRIEDVKRRSWSFRTQVSIASCNSFLCLAMVRFCSLDSWPLERGRCNSATWEVLDMSCAGLLREENFRFVCPIEVTDVLSWQNTKPNIRIHFPIKEPSKWGNCCLYRRQLSRVFP